MAIKNKLNLISAQRRDLTIGAEYYVNNGSKPSRQIVRRQLPSETDDEYSAYKRFLGYIVDEGICFLDNGGRE